MPKPGHGCPPESSPLVCCRQLRWLAARWRQLPLLLALVFLITSSAQAGEVRVRLRMAWGGGTAQAWQGTIKVSEGTIEDVLPLGLEADSPGSMFLADSATLRIEPRSPHSYDGCDLQLHASADARVIIELTPVGGSPLPPIELPLAKVAKEFMQFPLDEAGNRLLAQRSPGDRLAVKLDRPNLIFKPGEKFAFEVAPSAIDLAVGSSYTLYTTLTKGRSTAELSSDQADFKTDETATPLLAPKFVIPLPQAEGVYDLEVSLFQKRLTSSLVKGKPLAKRKIQVLILGENPPPLPQAEQAIWSTVLEFDPSKDKWWDKVTRMPSFKTIPGFGPGTLGNEKAQSRSYLGKTLVELRPGVWQAYPLALNTTGDLHMLEIEYPSDWRQTLSISLVEPNAAGEIVPIGLDTGIETPEPQPGATGKLEKLRIPFWPKTKNPWILLANRRDDSAALFGKISVQMGPVRLPPAEAPTVASPVKNMGGRKLVAYLDRPLLAENFAGTEVVDPITGRSLEDWQTFYEAGLRLVETLQHQGYTSAVINVACEGSALYPSRRWQPTPQLDTGMFFENGQDPLRKDVVEMLMQLFDRAGLQLVPSVKFASPLPELEMLLRDDPASAAGLMPVGADGQTWIGRMGLKRGLGVYYNPLDTRVQAAMRGVVEELGERYGHHPSFGGVAVQWEGEGYAILPDENASLDDVTMQRFAQQTGTDVSHDGPNRFAARAQILRGSSSKVWLDWRAAEMASFYRRMQADLARHHAGALLYFGTGELLATKQIQAALRPALPSQRNLGALLLTLGVDPGKFATASGIVLPRPQRVLPAATVAAGLQSHWNQATELDAPFATLPLPAAQHFLEPAPLRLASFDAVSPFGAEKTRSWFMSQIPPSGAAARQRFARSLAAADMQMLLDGGWMLPWGQTESLRPFTDVFRRLPPEVMTTVTPPAEETLSQPVVVRQLRLSDRTSFYVVNPSPWPLTVEVEFSTTGSCQFIPYAAQRVGETRREAGRMIWTILLEPYDLVGGEVIGSTADVKRWRVTLDTAIQQALAQQIRELRLRANSLRTPDPTRQLGNAGFEAPRGGAAGIIPGWVAADGEGNSVEVLDSAGYESRHALRLASTPGPTGTAPVTWLRSEPFAAPKTGRLALFAWIKLADSSQQPKLRLALEGKYEGKTYYRRRNIGASEDGRPVKPLQSGWALYRFSVTDLPLAGLSEMRVGFDLMDAGEVLIDDVQVYDLSFEDNERDELLKNIATADFQLSSGSFGDCQRFLEGYWAQFLRTHVVLDTSATASSRSSTTAPISGATKTPGTNARSLPAKGSPGNTQRLPAVPTGTKAIKNDAGKNETPTKELPAKDGKPAGVFDRMKGWLPRSPFR